MTIVSLMVRCEWKLSTFSMSVLQTALLASLTVSSFLLSNLGDRYGRKPLVIVGDLGVFVVGVLCGFCTEYWHLLLCRLIMGAFAGIGIGPATTYTTEIPSIRFRAFGLAMYNVGWGVGTAVTSGLAYFTVGPFGWQGYLVASALIGLPSLIVLLLIRESPRYDAQAGKIHEAQKTVEVLAKLNCKQLNECEIIEDPNIIIGQEMSTFYQSYQTLKETGYTLEFWILLCIQFTGQVAYTSMLYGSPLFMNGGYCSTAAFVESKSCTFDDSVLFDLGVIGLADLFGIVFGILIVNCIGRIRLTFVSAIFPLLSLSFLYVCAGSQYLLAVLIITRGAVAILPYVISLIAAESFPTRVRAFTVSVQAAVGCFASVLSSYLVAYAYEANPRFVIIIIQGMLLITSVGACFIKRETSGTQLD